MPGESLRVDVLTSYVLSHWKSGSYTVQNAEFFPPLEDLGHVCSLPVLGYV